MVNPAVAIVESPLIISLDIDESLTYDKMFAGLAVCADVAADTKKTQKSLSSHSLPASHLTAEG
jgi:hypothetical protein